MYTKKNLLGIFVTVLSLTTLFGTAYGQQAPSKGHNKGVISINQEKALEGEVTPGDAPGFPVTISVPGSYELSGNLQIPDANTSGIVVTADNVTLNLNGFSITGGTTCTGIPVQSCSPLGSGNGVDSNMANTVVLNGTIQGMGANGLFLFGNGKKYRVEKVNVNNNGNTGIYMIFSRGNIVTGNMAYYNRVRGIDAAFGSVVEGNTVDGNGEIGIVANSGCNASNNVSTNNGSFGLAMGAAGYVNNVMQGNNNNGAQVNGGIAMGGNVCGNALCP